jgi:transketolase
MHFESGVGHLGGNLSSLDAMLVLHHRVMGPEDQFVLSKGHSAGALYITLWSLGRLPDEELKTFHKDHTRLSGHPAPHQMPEIPFATGSLGHGLSLAAGLALAKKLKGEKGRVFCLLSDGEWQEGSNWEALIFTVRRALDNLTLILDSNGLQGFGSVREVAGIESMKERFQSFGVSVTEVDGHDLAALEGALKFRPSGTPNVVIAKTRKGKGVSFMENKMEWHYLPLNEAQYRQAVEEVEKA